MKSPLLALLLLLIPFAVHANPSAQGSTQSGVSFGAPQDNVKSFLVVTLDDVSKLELSPFNASSLASMPNLDALAANGVRFENFYAEPKCSVTRAEFNAGRRTFRHGSGGNVNEPHLPRMLDRAGPGRYAKAVFGKLDVSTGAPAPDAHKSAGQYGFEVYQGLLGSGVQDYRLWPWFDLIATSTDLADITTNSGPTPPFYLPPTVTDYVATRITNDLIAWLSALPQGKPFYAQYGTPLPHFPLHDPTSEDGANCDPPLDQTNDCYTPMIELADTELGRIVAHLNALGRLDDTIIMVFPDNGSAYGGKNEITEAGVNVGLVVGYGGVPYREAAITDVAGLPDLYMTILDYAGVWDLPENLPDDASDANYWGQPLLVDGVSFRGVLGTCATPDCWPAVKAAHVYAETFLGTAWRMFRDNSGYKLWETPALTEWRLYNIASDPTEATNLCTDATCTNLGGADLAAYDTLKADLATLLASEPTP